MCCRLFLVFLLGGCAVGWGAAVPGSITLSGFNSPYLDGTFSLVSDPGGSSASGGSALGADDPADLLGSDARSASFAGGAVSVGTVADGALGVLVLDSNGLGGDGELAVFEVSPVGQLLYEDGIDLADQSDGYFESDFGATLGVSVPEPGVLAGVLAVVPLMLRPCRRCGR